MNCLRFAQCALRQAGTPDTENAGMDQKKKMDDLPFASKRRIMSAHDRGAAKKSIPA